MEATKILFHTLFMTFLILLSCNSETKEKDSYEIGAKLKAEWTSSTNNVKVMCYILDSIPDLNRLKNWAFIQSASALTLGEFFFYKSNNNNVPSFQARESEIPMDEVYNIIEGSNYYALIRVNRLKGEYLSMSYFNKETGESKDWD